MMLKRCITLLLCLIMLINLVPPGAFAEGGTVAEETAARSQTVAEMLADAGVDIQPEETAPEEQPADEEEPAGEPEPEAQPADEEEPAGEPEPEAQPADEEEPEAEPAAEITSEAQPADEKEPEGEAVGETVSETQTEESPALFSRGLAYIGAGETIWQDARFRTDLAVTLSAGVVYAESRELTQDPDRDPVRVVFLYGNQDYHGYVPAGKLTELTAEQQNGYMAALADYRTIGDVRLGEIPVSLAEATPSAEEASAESEAPSDEAISAEEEASSDEAPAGDEASSTDETPAGDEASSTDEAPAGDEAASAEETSEPAAEEAAPEDGSAEESPDDPETVLPEGVLSDGDWLYRVENGFAAVVGYLNTEAVSLSVPRLLGGYYVNAIDDAAFAGLSCLEEIRVHGNVISLRGNPFPATGVTLKGYNGTQVLAWAKEHGFASVNLTSHPYFEFQEHVVDYSYADTAHFRFAGAGTLRMHVAEAAQLAVGSMFYTPVRQNVYCVTGIQLDREWAVLSIGETQFTDALTRLHAEHVSGYADWSRAEWADGVVVHEEKEVSTGQISLEQTWELGSINLKNGKSAPVSLFTSGSLELILDASIDVQTGWAWFIPYPDLQSMDIRLTAKSQLKGGIRVGYNATQNAESTSSVFTDSIFGTMHDDYYLCSVPIVGIPGVLELRVALYFRVEVSGEISISVQGQGDLFRLTYSKRNGWKSGNSFRFSAPVIEAAIDFDFGLVPSVEIYLLFFGRILAVECFVGLEIELKATYSHGSISGGGYVGSGGFHIGLTVDGDKLLCLDASISFKISAGFNSDVFDLSGLTNISDKFEIKNSHYELNLTKKTSGFVNKCSRAEIVSVLFVSGLSFIHFDSLQVKPGDSIAAPSYDNPGYVLEGWYKDRQFTQKWNFATDKVTEDIILYAKWDLPIHTVTFVTNTPEGNYTEEVYDGEAVSMPSSIRWANHKLTGWYKDAGFTTEWDFATEKVTSDVSIYAKWEESPGYDPFGEDDGGTGSGGSTYTGEYYRGYQIRYCEATGHKYVHIMEYKTYSEAMADAAAAGGYLATVNTAAEQAFLAKYLYDDCAQTYLWLGMISQGGWRYWGTHEKVIYTNWASDPLTTSTQYNAAIIRSSGKWTTLSNTEQAHYVIEIGEPDADPAYEEQKTDFQYTVDKNSGTALITGWINPDATTLTAESYYQGYPVVGIAANALKNNTVVQHVVLPNTIVSVGDSAFEGCTALRDVTLPDTVTSVGDQIFYGCTALQQAVWSRKLTSIPAYTFYGCSGLTTVKNLEDVRQIGNYAFWGCSSLQNAIPPKVTAIGNSAYSGNTSMNSIRLPETVTSIGGGAFSGCGGTVISVPSGIVSIPSVAFSGCIEVQTVNLPESIQSIADNAFDAVDATFCVYSGSFAESWCRSHGKTVKSLNGKYRVLYMVGSTGEDTDSAPETTEVYAAYGARLTEPSVSADGKTIAGWYLDPEFRQPWSFATDKMPDHNITLYARWVEDESLFGYNVSGGGAIVTGYSGHAASVVIPDTLGGYPVTQLAAGAFVNAEVRTLTIPATVKTINSGAIRCPNLYTVVCAGTAYFSVHEDGVLYNKNGSRLIYAPEGRAYQSYTVPDGVVYIYAYAFSGNNTLRSLTVPDSVTRFMENALGGNHMTIIYGSVDPDCTAARFAREYGYSYNLYEIRYHSGEDIVYTANAQAGGLIPYHDEPGNNVLHYGGWYKDAALTDPWDFENDIMPASAIDLYLKMDSLFGYTVSGGYVTITGYHGPARSVIIPEEIDGRTVTQIAAGAFTDGNLLSVTVPGTVTTIEPNAVAGGIRIIGDADTEAQAYASREGLTFTRRRYVLSFESMGGSAIADKNVMGGAKVTLPEPVRTNYHFMGWYTDTSYDSSVQWTDETRMPTHDVVLYAYWKIVNPNITNDFTYALLDDGTAEITGYSGSKIALSVPGTINGYTVTRIGDHAFEGNKTVLSVSLPAAVTEIGYCAFARSAVRTVSGAGNLAVIEDAAFMNAASLTSVNLTKQLRSIGNRAFEGCTALMDISLPSGLASIGEYAFHGCAWLYTATFPTTLAYLGRDAFTDCPNLATVTLPNNLVNEAARAFDSTTTVHYKNSSVIAIRSAEVIGQTQVELVWNKVLNASSYGVYYRRAGSGSFLSAGEFTDRTCTVALQANNRTYEFYVTALNGDGEVLTQSGRVSVTMSKLETPEIVSVTQTGRHSADMTLSTVTGAEGYELERADDMDGPFTFLKDIPASGTCTNTGLVSGHDFYYRVRAYVITDDERVYSRYSGVFHFYMPLRYLTAPQHLAARQADANSVELTWDPVDDADGYVVWQSLNGTDFTEAGTVYTAQFLREDLEPGASLTCRVTAFFMDQGERMESKPSSPAEVTLLPVATPKLTGLSSTKTGIMTLRWSAVAGADGYMVYRSVNGGDYVRVNRVFSSTALYFDDTTPAAGNTHAYQVRAFVLDENGSRVFGGYSPSLSMKMPAVAQVTGVKVQQTDADRIRITWTALKNVTDYEVWVSANNENIYQLAASAAGASAEVEGMKDGVTYYVKVRAVSPEDAAVFGAYSDSVSVVILGTPELVAAEQKSATSALLIWSEVSSADGYEVWRMAPGETEFSLLRRQSARSYTNSSLTADALYTYKVRAYRNENGSRVYGTFSGARAVRLLGVPQITSIERTASATVRISWNEVAFATGYDVYMSTVSDGVYEKVKTTTNCYADKGSLGSGKTVYFKVVPYATTDGEKGYGIYSPVKAYTLLAKPVISSVEKTGDGQVTVTWAKVENAAYYLVYSGTSEKSMNTETRVTTNKAVFNGLATGKRYYYKVVACRDATGLTSRSAESAVKNLYLSVLTRAALTSFEQPAATSVTVFWDKITNAQGYELYRADTADGAYKLIKSVTGCSYTNTGLTTGATYYYKVRAYRILSSTEERVYGQFSAARKATPVQAMSFDSTEASSTGAITLTWSAYPDATGYNIYRAPGGGSYALVKYTTALTYKDTGITGPAKYSYKIAPVMKPSGSVTLTGPLSAARTVQFGGLASGKIASCVQTDTTAVRLRWNAVEGTEKFEVWRAEGANGEFVRVKSMEGLETTFTTLTPGVTYRFRVRPYIIVNSVRYYGGYSAVKEFTLLNVTALTRVRENPGKTVSLRWNAIEGATSYQVWRKAGSGSYTCIRTITDGSVAITDTTVKAGVTYSYKICVRRGESKSWSEPVSLSVTGNAYPESDHNYENRADETWTYSIPGASSLVLVFSSQTMFESGYDRLYISDGTGTQIQGSPFSGSSLSGKTVIVPGDTVTLRLTSDGSVTYYGFSFDSILPGDE